MAIGRLGDWREAVRRLQHRPILAGAALFFLTFALGASLALIWALTRPGDGAPRPALTGGAQEPAGEVALPVVGEAPGLVLPPPPQRPDQRAPIRLRPPAEPPRVAPGSGPADAHDREARPREGQTAPRYPPRAYRRGDQGEVLLRVTVDARGRPRRVAVARSSGFRDLDRAAVDAVRQWQFTPALDDGEAVASEVLIPIEFRRR